MFSNLRGGHQDAAKAAGDDIGVADVVAGGGDAEEDIVPRKRLFIMA